jgi:radical SAM enzyme (TIGR01210 family)
MSKNHKAVMNSSWIVSQRGNRNKLDPGRPYAYLVEKERNASGKIEETAIIFLTNKECSFTCLMCDLWKNTTDISVPEGSIPAQIEWALSKMPRAKHLKLYNSGSFFDERAIPEKDYAKIASLVEHFETVIVEAHPRLIGEKCLRFRDMLKPELEVAIGLETVHPEVLQKLNKQMTPQDFRNGVNFLSVNNIKSRAFILLRPPFMSESEGVYWAKRSLDFAFQSGIECCIVIPVRPGNGAMDLLMKNGDFSLPKIPSLEEVLEYGISLGQGRVFADVWDLKLFSTCGYCFDERIERLIQMNLQQKLTPQVSCNCDFHDAPIT